MKTVESRTVSHAATSASGSPVPSARPLSEFCAERVGDDVVLYDATLNRYHTLNAPAYDIWRLCDGVRSVEQIRLELQQNELVSETVALAVAQLGESGLLQAPESKFDSTLHRRKMLKLAIAGVAGAAGIPVILSITSPDSQAAATGCGNLGEGCDGDKPCCSTAPMICNGNPGQCVKCVPSGSSCSSSPCCSTGVACTGKSCP